MEVERPNAKKSIQQSRLHFSSYAANQRQESKYFPAFDIFNEVCECTELRVVSDGSNKTSEGRDFRFVVLTFVASIVLDILSLVTKEIILIDDIGSPGLHIVDVLACGVGCCLEGLDNHLPSGVCRKRADRLFEDNGMGIREDFFVGKNLSPVGLPLNNSLQGIRPIRCHSLGDCGNWSRRSWLDSFENLRSQRRSRGCCSNRICCSSWFQGITWCLLLSCVGVHNGSAG